MLDVYLLNLIGRLTKKDLKIEIDGEIIKYEPAKKIQISPLFFRSHRCIRCGKCCRKITEKLDCQLYWTENEYYDLPDKLKEELKIVPIKVNEKEKYLYQYDTMKDKSCKFLKNSKCTIHDIKPIQCAISPIYVDREKQGVRIIKRMIGRNWKFGCPMELGKFDEKQFKESDLIQLERLEKSARDLDIETFFPIIINKLKEIKLPTKIQIL